MRAQDSLALFDHLPRQESHDQYGRWLLALLGIVYSIHTDLLRAE